MRFSLTFVEFLLCCDNNMTMDFDELIIQLKSIGLNVVKDNDYVENQTTLNVYAEPPLFIFQMLNNDTTYYNAPTCKGRIRYNDSTYLIMRYKNPKTQQTLLDLKGQVINGNLIVLVGIILSDNPDNTINFEIKGETSQTSSIVANTSPKSKDFTKYNNPKSKDPTQNLFFIDYAQRYPYLNLYQQTICENLTITQDYKTFELYCTIVYIAMKSKLFKSKGNVCKIYPEHLIAILPNDLKRKPNSKEPKERIKYSKSYTTFINSAIEAGMLTKAELNEEHHYIEMTVSDVILKGINTYPYNKIPFGLLNDMNKYNFNFFMYFINRMFTIHPSKPHFVSIKVQDLIKIANISTNQSAQHCADRLNNCFWILKKYNAISPMTPLLAADIRNNKLLQFRLYKFAFDSQDDEDEEPGEESSNTSSDDELDEPTPPNPKAKKFIPSEAFLKANAEIDAR